MASKKKTAKKISSKKPDAVLPPVPQVEDGHVTVVVSKEELSALLSLLAFTTNSCEFLAENALKEGNLDVQATYLAKVRASMILRDKFTLAEQIGEPVSRERH